MHVGYQCEGVSVSIIDYKYTSAIMTLTLDGDARCVYISLGNKSWSPHPQLFVA